MVRWILQSGIAGGMEPKEANRVYLTNLFSLISVLYLVLRSIYYVYSLHPLGGWQLLGGLMFSAVVIANKNHRYILARFILILLSNTLIFVLSYIYYGGDKGGGYALYFITVMLPLVLFDIKQRRYIIAGSLISFIYLTLLMSLAIFEKRESVFTGMELAYGRFSVAFLGMFLSFLTVYYFYKLNSQSEKVIEKEREKLFKKNRMIENDLVMARKIQESLLPQLIDVDNLFFYYQSMHELGGDFFDFKQFTDPATGKQKTGIFISDVSGHGITSAFVTLQIKNFIENAPNELLANPSKTLWNLNKTLYGQVAENFVTGLWGVYDDTEKTFIYSNAGHPMPYLITENGAHPLPKTYREMPLAVHSSDLFDRDGSFRENRLTLKKGDMLFFYTDGITEATPASGAGDFESDQLNEILPELYNSSPSVAAKQLLARLVRYHQSDQFNDDICIAFLRA